MAMAWARVRQATVGLIPSCSKFLVLGRFTAPRCLATPSAVVKYIKSGNPLKVKNGNYLRVLRLTFWTANVSFS